MVVQIQENEILKSIFLNVKVSMHVIGSSNSQVRSHLRRKTIFVFMFSSNGSRKENELFSANFVTDSLFHLIFTHPLHLISLYLQTSCESGTLII